MGFDLSEDVLLLSQQHAFFAFYPLSTSHPRKLRVSSSSHLRRRRYPDTCAQHVALSSNARSRPPRWRTLGPRTLPWPRAPVLQRARAFAAPGVVGCHRSTEHLEPGCWGQPKPNPTLTLALRALPRASHAVRRTRSRTPVLPPRRRANLAPPSMANLDHGLLLRLTQPHPNHPLPCATGCR